MMTTAAHRETQPFQEPLAIHGEGHRGSGGEVCASFDAWPESAIS
jgi:hypothetical protein